MRTTCRAALSVLSRPCLPYTPSAYRLRKRPTSGGPLAAPAEKVHPRCVCTFPAGRITHSAACQRLTCRAGSLLLVRKEKAHILKVGVRHGLQLPDRLPGQRLHIPVHIGEGGGHAAHRPAPVGLVVRWSTFFVTRTKD